MSDEIVVDLIPDDLSLARAQLTAGLVGQAEGSLRRHIARLDADADDGRLREILQRRAFTRIGKGLKPGAEIPRAKIEEVAGVVASHRELAEETGYTGGNWELLGSLASSPSLKDNWAYLFLARGVEETTPPDPDEHELVEVVRVPVKELPHLVHTGKIVSSSGVAAIMLALERLREDL